jgi:hypothetical protein
MVQNSFYVFYTTNLKITVLSRNILRNQKQNTYVLCWREFTFLVNFSDFLFFLWSTKYYYWDKTNILKTRNVTFWPVNPCCDYYKADRKLNIKTYIPEVKLRGRDLTEISKTQVPWQIFIWLLLKIKVSHAKIRSHFANNFFSRDFNQVAKWVCKKVVNWSERGKKYSKTSSH